jgi:hypothetical protein
MKLVQTITNEYAIDVCLERGLYAVGARMGTRGCTADGGQ